MTRIVGPAGSKRRRRFLFVPALLVAAVALILVVGASASYSGGVQDTGLFQLDRNTSPGLFGDTTVACGTTATGGDDWAALYNHRPTGTSTTPPCGSDGYSFVHDDVGSADTTYWSGGGSKDAYDPALGPWQWAPNDVSPDKNDIVNAYAAIYHVNPTTDNIPFLFFGSDRFNTNGDAQMGFQFLQASTCLAGPVSGVSAGGDAGCLSGTPTAPTGCTPAFTKTSNAGYFVDPTTGCPVDHTAGDILVLINFNKGGTLGLAGVFSWTGGASGSYTNVLSSGTSAANPPADCVGPPSVGDPNNFCATASTGDLLGEPIWPYTTKGVGGAQSSYGASNFVEGGVNLAFLGDAGACFPTYIAETRSSAGPSSGLSLQAQLKDLAFGRFQLCKPSTSLAASANVTIHSGNSTTLSFSETNDGSEALTSPNVIANNGCSPALFSGDTDSDGILDVGETWVFHCTVSPTVTTTYSAYGVGTGQQSGILVTGISPCTPSSTTVCSAAERASVIVTVIAPSTSLTKTAQVSVTYTFKEANTGNDALSGVSVTDAYKTGSSGLGACTVAAVLGTAGSTTTGDATHNVGDINNNDKLDTTETWTFRCTVTSTDGADVDTTDTGTGHGTDSTNVAVPTTNESDGVRVQVTHCSGPCS